MVTIQKQKPIINASAPIDENASIQPWVTGRNSGGPNDVPLTSSEVNPIVNVSDIPIRLVQSSAIIECFGDLDVFKEELWTLLKSPNPLTLYNKGNEIREKFSHFVNCLATQVALGFSSRNSAFIVSLYYSAGYQKIWLDHFRYYFADAKYFDRQTYFLFVTLFSKDRQLLAKGLLKLYKKETKTDIEKLLKAYENRRFSDTKKPKKLTYTEILATYKALGIDKITEKIHPKYLSENEIEKFLDQVSLHDEVDLEQLLSLFNIQFKDTKEYFDESYTVFAYITRSYLNGNEQSKQVRETVNALENTLIKLRIDKLIARYKYEKSHFYIDLQSVLSEKNSIECGYFWSYIHTQLINIYYPSVTRLFYWNTSSCENRNEWARLRGDFKPAVNTRFKDETNGMLAFKKLILELDANIFSPFLKPIVYSIVSERLNITQKDLYKLRYLLTLVMSESYDEYRRIATFFDELEAFLWFGTDRYFSVFAKIKIFGANIVLSLAGIILLYVYAPIGVTVSIFILGYLFVKRHLFAYHGWVKWNFGLRTFAIGLLTISSFFWFLNLEKTKTDIGVVTTKVEQLWVVRTDVAVDLIAKKLDTFPVQEMVANVLGALKTKKEQEKY